MNGDHQDSSALLLGWQPPSTAHLVVDAIQHPRKLVGMSLQDRLHSEGVTQPAAVWAFFQKAQHDE